MITIFGATGRTGRYIVDQALAQGDQVRAFTRSPEKISIEHENLKVIKGDINEYHPVAGALKGASAVISALGPKDNRQKYAISRGMENILKAMKEEDVSRLVISAGAGVGDPEDDPKPVDRFFNFILGILSRNVYEDMKRVAELVRRSELDWTIVRAPMLTDEPGSGKIRVGMLGEDLGIRLSREDFAQFMLDQVREDTYLRKAPVISN